MTSCGKMKIKRVIVKMMMMVVVVAEAAMVVVVVLVMIMMMDKVKVGTLNNSLSFQKIL
jgi:hypothetical protein